MRTVTISSEQWLQRFAESLGVEPPAPEEVNDLLAMAGVAAHASERTAAPISCWLVARSGRTASEGRALASELAASLGDPPG